ncbi:hypothetical protein [Campylobacter ureolyticus]|nr:hypothetical protein [Campylobacter ureolyticus]MCZ6110644.1 hypothetical protein [Campylobacter ureolyticus]MDK8323032.1 hypothetical protein [Campylobacter ureolyticus]
MSSKKVKYLYYIYKTATNDKKEIKNLDALLSKTENLFIKDIKK